MLRIWDGNWVAFKRDKSNDIFFSKVIGSRADVKPISLLVFEIYAPDSLWDGFRWECDSTVAHEYRYFLSLRECIRNMNCDIGYSMSNAMGFEGIG